LSETISAAARPDLANDRIKPLLVVRKPGFYHQISQRSMPGLPGTPSLPGMPDFLRFSCRHYA
jgi:hypothetical protein